MGQVCRRTGRNRSKVPATIDTLAWCPGEGARCRRPHPVGHSSGRTERRITVAYRASFAHCRSAWQHFALDDYSSWGLEMSRAKRAIHRRHRPVLLAVGVVAAVTVAAGVAIARFGSPDQPTTQPAHSASHPAHSASHSLPTTSSASLPTAGSSPTGGSSASSVADACAAEIRTTEAVVAAARTGAEHWREHVQARTDLLTGKNPEATTKAIWKRTRLAGPGDISALNSALTAQAKAAGGCAKVSGSAAVACKKRLTVLDATAAADRAAAADWANHLAMMAAHAAGDFGAEHAQEMWVAAWTHAPQNLNAAARANTALAKAPACKP